MAVAALLIAGLLAGCDDEDPPDSKESTSAPAPPTTSATTETTPTDSVEPTFPDAAKARNKSGVEAFVRFYWEVVNYATKSGDVDLLERLDQPSCDGCEGGIQGIKRVYGRGGRIVGGEYAVVRLQPIPSSAENWAVITHTSLGKQRTIGAGNLNGTFGGGRAKWLVGVALVRGSWSVTTLEVL